MSLASEANNAANAAETTFVNYIWLSPRDREKSRADVATHLPLHYFERVYANAEKYPDAKFSLWLDYKQIGGEDRFMLDSHRYIFNCENIAIRNLREISTYNQKPGFDPDSNIALYAKADFARILVLAHLLGQNRKSTAIYADLDCEDIKIKDEAVRASLEEFGFALGHAGRNRVCNGYIALHGEKGLDFLTSYVLPRTDIAFQKNLTNHYGAFTKAVGHYRRENYPDLPRRHWGLVHLPLMRTTMPYDENMYEGVCPPRPARIPHNRDFV